LAGDMTGNVIGPAFGAEPNVSGGLHELANRPGIRGAVIIIRLDTGEYEHIRMGMDMAEHSHAAMIVMESATRRIRTSIETGQTAP
jgi:hypothetical protein